MSSKSGDPCSGAILAVAKEIPKIQVVLDKKAITEIKKVEDIILSGNKKDILTFLKEKDLCDEKVFNFNSIYWLLEDKSFFLEFIKIMKEKCIFDYTTWTYSLKHEYTDGIMELLKSK